MPNQQHARKPVKTNSRVLSSASALQLQTSFSALVQPDNHVVQKFDTGKIYQLSNEVIFSPPFLSVSPFLLLSLARRQSYACAIDLYTRPEIKSWPDIKFCAHAQCVLPRCCPHLYSALSKFKCLAAKQSCLNPPWAYLLVTCPRLGPNDGITARRCAWMSPEETVVVLIQ